MSPRTRLLNYSLAPYPLWPLRVPSDVCYWPTGGHQVRLTQALRLMSTRPSQRKPRPVGETGRGLGARSLSLLAMTNLTGKTA
jgi:hypothetical protein